MKYFIDTEFIEGVQQPTIILRNILGRIVFGIPKPTIDLISIGIIAEDGREYYAISKEFNIKEAWNRYQIVNNNDNITVKARRKGFNYIHTSIIIPRKVYWLRDNVLKPIYDELVAKEVDNYKGFVDPYYELELDFTYRNFKRLINKYGKTNKQIAEEIKDYVYYKSEEHKTACCLAFDNIVKPQFYGYYSDYDWVVFCWLFGKMIDLPKGFPMYCKDVKQEFDEFINKYLGGHRDSNEFHRVSNLLKDMETYPKKVNEHNALADARWIKELHEFLNK